MSSQRGREVLRGILLHKRKGGSCKKRNVAAYCGMQSTDQSSKHIPAQLQLYEVNDKVEKPGQKPKSTVSLFEAKIESNYTSPPQGAYTTMIVPETANLSASPSTTPSSTGSHSGSGIVGSQGSGSGSGVFASGMHKFTITTSNGEVHEFRTESENDRLRWVKLLQLLVMFPYSSIPEEPSSDPIKKLFQEGLDPNQYGADSVWPVYILPEEVGSKCSIIGANIIALKSGVPGGSIGKLDIFSPVHTTKPLVSWDRDKMRRTGKTGQLVFIEIGRRCEGGPGLVWMYTGFKKAQALRETLHNFLFQGDGKAVDIPIQQGPIYDTPRASFDASLPPSYQKRGSVPSGYNNHVLTRSRSHDPDSGCPASPGSFMNTPPLEGPPVRLDKHPSIRRKNATKPRDIKRSNSKESPSGSYTSARSVDSAIDTVSEQDEFPSNDQSRSNTPPDECDGEIIGQMDPDASITYYDEVPSLSRRSHTVPASQGMQERVILPGRAHSTASCTTMEYESMTHPKDSAMFKYDGYVFMRSKNMPASVPIPVGNTNTYNQLNHFPQRQSPQQNGAPRSRNNYDQLPTISEKRRVSTDVDSEKPSNYENHPLPQDLKGVSPHVYRPSYENVEKAKRDRRGSQNQEQYENVTATGEQVRSPQANANGNNNGDKKRISLRRKSSVKEQVKLSNGTGPSISGQEVKTPSPPRVNGLEQGIGYLVVQSDHGKSYETHPTIKSVKYTHVNFPNTEAFHEMRAQRAEQKAMVRNEC